MVPGAACKVAAAICVMAGLHSCRIVCIRTSAECSCVVANDIPLRERAGDCNL
jgi:hypothetical protein